MIKLIAFDLDGTLLNTLDDLHAAVNHALREMGFPERTVDEVRRFIGNGVKKLMERSTPEGTSEKVNAECLDYNTIMNALQKGEFYCSTGPEIYSLVRKGNTVTIKTSPAKRIALSTQGRRCDVLWGDGITEATFELQPTDGYFRITVDDFSGNHAHSQAYEVK